jgi:outer membrane lipoprotein-sorting protein
MSIAVPATVRRWLVPASAALAVVGGGVAIGVVTNAADSALPPRSAEELLVDLQTAQVDGLQGTVTFRADLGLPPLPVPSLGSADLGSLVTGTHTLRIWYAKPGQVRLALLGRDSETDIITNGTDVWVWSSREQTALHGQLPSGGIAGLVGALIGGPRSGLPAGSSLPDLAETARAAGRPNATVLPTPAGLDPARLASLALTFLEAFETDVTTNSDATVAGRRAYELTLAPRDQRALVKSIVIAVDAEAGIPLRLAVLARDGGAPALEVAFTEVRLTRPDPAQFEFRPPPGTTVVEADELVPSDHRGTPGADATESPSEAPGELDTPWFDAESSGRPPLALIGRGWTTVVAVRLPGVPDKADGESRLGELAGLLPPVSGDWGSGRLLTTRLFSVLLTDDGRLLAGAVPPDMLYAAAADPATRLGS